MIDFMKDLTRGSIYKLIVSFAIPLFLGNLLQLTYNIVDTKLVSMILGQVPLAAVGSTNSLNTMIIGFLNGLTNGFAVIAAQHFGANDKAGLKRTVAGAFKLGTLISVLLTVLICLNLTGILRLLNTPEEILSLAYDYILIIFGGMTALMLYNVASSLLRAVGDTVTPLIFLALSCVSNIVMDWFFMAVIPLGVRGAAIATVLAQGLAMVACFWYMFRKYPFLRPGREDFVSKMDRQLLVKLLSTGLSMGMMACLVDFGSVALQFSINMFGTDIIVAHTTARKLTSVFMLMFGVLGMTMATFSGQNFGAGQYSRIRKGIRTAVGITWVWTILVIILVHFFAGSLVGALASTTDSAVIDPAVRYLRVDTAFYFVPAMVTLIRNSMQGFGDRITPIVSSFIELAGKVLVVIFLAPALGYFGIILAEPIVWFVMVIPLIVQLLRNKSLKRPDVVRE
jgi:putative MATE family efflux protein